MKIQLDFELFARNGTYGGASEMDIVSFRFVSFQPKTEVSPWRTFRFEKVIFKGGT